jgi:hypothetical protein
MSKAPRVFIPQIIKKFNREKPGTPITFDFSAAERFGEINVILSDDDDVDDLVAVTRKIKLALDDFDDNDYLIAVGDPTVIAICSGEILIGQDNMKMLRWDRHRKDYFPVEIKL